EHLEIHTTDPDATLARIHNAGAIFLGSQAPVSTGDYLPGSNHLLPTAGHARFSASLSAMTFLRPRLSVHYDQVALRAVADRIRAFGDAEDLPAQGEAVAARFEA